MSDFKNRLDEIQRLLRNLESSTLSDDPKHLLKSKADLEEFTEKVTLFLDASTEEEKKAYKEEFISLMASLNITLQRIETEKDQVREKIGKVMHAISAQKGYQK